MHKRYCSAIRWSAHPVDSWQTHRRLGMGSEQMLDELLGNHATSLRERTKKAHSAQYAQHADHLRPFDGAAEFSGGFGKAELEAAGAVAVYDDAAALLAGPDASSIATLLG